MSDGEPIRQVVFTNKARCRDCYRCVRVCPVKAIRMSEGQAYVVEGRCIGCGTCVRECPQRAKSYRNDTQRAERLFAPGVMVAASVAPSFAAAFPQFQRQRLPSALRQLGFAYVGETAIGAYHVAAQTAAVVAAQRTAARVHGLSRRGALCGTYRPELIPPWRVSPMLATPGIRKSLRIVCVVFIGPCGQEAEAERPEHAGMVDCVHVRRAQRMAGGKGSICRLARKS